MHGCMVTVVGSSGRPFARNASRFKLVNQTQRTGAQSVDSNSQECYVGFSIDQEAAVDSAAVHSDRKEAQEESVVEPVVVERRVGQRVRFKPDRLVYGQK